MYSSKAKDLKEIGFYKIQEKIGKGYNSLVYKALNTQDSSIIAIKQFRIKNLHKNTIENMKMNLKLLQNLTHENLVKYIDNIQTETHLYIIQEYIPSIINKETALSEEIAALLTRQILQGLDYLHSYKILHRDIKRSNLLSSDARQMKLLNYATPTRLGELENGDIPDNSLYWMAPEVLKGESRCCGSDIWSLGCTIIELLTGFPPYYGDKPMEFAMKMVGEEEVPLPETISKDCKDFLRKCLDKDGKKRGSVKELLDHPWVRNEKVEKEMEEFERDENKSQINEKED